MPKTHYLQSSFTTGVLDPRLAARTDIRQYYQGMSVGRNVLPVPMGGVKRRPGMPYKIDLPYINARVTNGDAGFSSTAPEGGSATAANDGSDASQLITTTNLGTLNPYVIVRYDLGSSKSIFAVDVLRIRITSGSAPGPLNNFLIQYSTDDVAWTFFDPAFGPGGHLAPIDTGFRNFRRAAGTPSQAVTARYWRLVRLGGADLGTAKVELGEFNLWITGSTISEVREIPFERSTDERYMVVFTDRNAIIVRDGAVDGIVPMPYASADLAELDGAQSADTMIITHDDHQTRQLLRESANNWQPSAIAFTGIPKFDFADSLSPAPTSEVQDITFTNFVEGNTFQLELEGARTGPIGYTPASTSTTAANIARAVQKLHTVGFSGVACAFTAGTTYRITLADESADSFDLFIGTPLAAGSTAAITAVEIANGVPRREDVWSATRGWPRTVTFHEGRLWFGGSRSLLQAYFASVVNDFFNFEIGEGLDDDAIFGILNTAQLNAVVAIKSGRFLQLFTSGGEFRFTSSPVTPADVPKLQTEYGTAQIKPVATDGATVFIQRTRKVLRDFLYRYEEDAYSSVPISALASHLLNGVKDMSAWQGSDEDDANYVFLINTDGSAAVYCTLRSQEIAAFSEWDTDGLWKAVGVVAEDRYFAVLRTLNGVQRLVLEMADDDYYTDCADKVNAGGVAQIPVSSFEHLIGEVVRIRTADHFVLGSQTVPPSGNMTLEIVPTDPVEVGLDWTPDVTTMPLNSDFGNGGNFLRKKRVTKMRCLVHETLGVLYNGRPLADRFWDLNNFDTAPVPYTGVHSLEETSNWDEGPLTQQFTQTDPLPFHLLGVDFTVESS